MSDDVLFMRVGTYTNLWIPPKRYAKIPSTTYEQHSPSNSHSTLDHYNNNPSSLYTPKSQ